MAKVIRIRKLAAVDMLWLGAWVVVAEYAVGVALPVGLGLASIWMALSQPGGSPNQFGVFGLWLLGIAANYVPLLFYAVAIARAGTVEQEGRPEMVHARRYGVQQTMILVPLLVVVVALWQERSARG
jgi:hypothetical protein